MQIIYAFVYLQCAGHLELPENEKEFINGLKRLLEGEGQNSFNAKMGKHFGMQQNG